MSNCPCQEKNGAAAQHVPNYALHGFKGQRAKAPNQFEMEGVLALNYSACVSASLQNNQVCFTLPYYGQYCITVPGGIPITGQVSVCAETCDKWGIPTGLRASVYLNNGSDPVFTVTLFGYC